MRTVITVGSGIREKPQGRAAWVCLSALNGTKLQPLEFSWLLFALCDSSSLLPSHFLCIRPSASLSLSPSSHPRTRAVWFGRARLPTRTPGVPRKGPQAPLPEDHPGAWFRRKTCFFGFQSHLSLLVHLVFNKIMKYLQKERVVERTSRELYRVEGREGQ